MDGFGIVGLCLSAQSLIAAISPFINEYDHTLASASGVAPEIDRLLAPSGSHSTFPGIAV
jgi:hypothetical protein